MTAAAKITLGLVFFVAISSPARQAAAPAADARTPDAVQMAEEEAVHRQEDTILLQMTLQRAAAAQKRGELVEAGKFYQEAVSLIPYVQVGNPAVELEKKQALAGLDAVREKLARDAMERGDMAQAMDYVESALKVDPTNETLRNLKAEIAKRTEEMRGMVPSPEVVKSIPAIQQQKIEAAQKIQDAKLLYEMGKYDEAKVILVKVLHDDPSNKTAPYYLDLIKEAQFAATARIREGVAKSAIAEVEKAWIPSNKRDSLPIPNPMAHTNLVYTSQGRQDILSKMEHIHFKEVSYKDLPLSGVLDALNKESQMRDVDQVGINFMWNPHTDAGITGVAPADNTGAANANPGAVAPPTAPVDENDITVNIDPPLRNVRLADVLDAITKVSKVPLTISGIKFTIEDYAVVFSPKSPDSPTYMTRVFRVDPNTFVQGLENVVSTYVGNSLGSSGSTGLSGSGGGGGGGGSGSSGGGTSSGNPTAQLPGVQVSTVSQGGTSGGGGAAGGAGGNRLGLSFVTKTNSTAELDDMVKKYFTATGVDLTAPGKVVFFNDRLGELLVRATSDDLEIIAQAIELLNQTPPELTIEAKFVELNQEDSRALGFNWYLGNTLVNNGAVGVQGGTAPSYVNPNGSAANPSGVFPGPGTPTTGGNVANQNGSFSAPFAVASSATDNLLTSGLRNIYTSGNTTGSIPTVGTITGILTDPQFRVAINAIQQRNGADVLYSPKVTTLSGRQAHIAAQDVETIVTTASVSTTSSSTGGLVGGTGVVTPSVNYTTTPFGLGPVLDVLPTVSADGFSIQMALLPTLLEFVGYDNPGAFVPTSEAAAGSTIGIPVTAQLPLPHFRARAVVTTCNVWDGQTVVLGGMISETITKIKDEIPVLGDLPLVGRLFQSQSTDNQKGNLLIFVTPTIIDPAGNRVHNDDDMPFARNSIPPQPPAAVQ